MALENFLAQLSGQNVTTQETSRVQNKGKLIFGWLYQPIAGCGVLQQCVVESLWSFITYDTDHRHVFDGFVGTGSGYIASGRNALVEQFVDYSDVDWLLMIDWDMTFSPKDVYALLDAADPISRPIVAGAYVTFMGDPVKLRPCWMRLIDGKEYTCLDDYEPGAIVECTMVGMGFTLVHRDVFEGMRKAYSDDPWHWFGHDMVGGHRVGEDITFCHRARTLGYKVFGHGGVQLGHTKTKVWTPSDLGFENK